MSYTHYSSQEQTDADAVERAQSLMTRGNIAEAENILLDVISRTPQFYVYSFESEKEIFVKFWDMPEYLGYISMTREVGEEVEMEVIWLRAAYPRALFFQALIDVKRNEFASAAERLDEALRLEPDHPEALCLLADMTLAGRDRKAALELYGLVLGCRPYMKGRTLQHAEEAHTRLLHAIGKEDEAGQSMAKSTGANADSAVVANVSRYRERLESGDKTAPVALRLEQSEIDSDEELSINVGSRYDPAAGVSAEQEVADVSESAEPEEQSTKVRKWWQVWR